MLILADNGRRTRGRSVRPVPAAPGWIKPRASLIPCAAPGAARFLTPVRAVLTRLTRLIVIPISFFIHTPMCVCERGSKRAQTCQTCQQKRQCATCFARFFRENCAYLYKCDKTRHFFRRFSARLSFPRATKRDNFCTDLLTFVKKREIFAYQIATPNLAH